MASMKTLRYLALLALFIGTAVAPGIASAQDGTGVIRGTVRGPAGNAVADVRVTVQGTNIAGVTTGDGDIGCPPFRQVITWWSLITWVFRVPRRRSLWPPAKPWLRI